MRYNVILWKKKIKIGIKTSCLLMQFTYLISHVFPFHKVPAAVCARHATDARVSDAKLATSCNITDVTRVTLSASRVQVPVVVTRATMATSWTITTCTIVRVTGVTLPVRRV